MILDDYVRCMGLCGRQTQFIREMFVLLSHWTSLETCLAQLHRVGKVHSFADFAIYFA
jgi:hypothetical protein